MRTHILLLMLSCLACSSALAQLQIPNKAGQPPAQVQMPNKAGQPAQQAKSCEKGFTWSAPYCVAAPCPNGWKLLPGPAPKCNNMGSVSTMKNPPCFHLGDYVGSKKVNYAGERCLYTP